MTHREPLNLSGTLVMLLVSLVVMLALTLALIAEKVYWPLDKIVSLHRRWYRRTTARAKRYLEHEARRFGGSIKWE